MTYIENYSIALDLQYVLDHFIEMGKKVNSSTEVYKRLCKALPQKINTIIRNENVYKIDASAGTTNRAECPWIAIMNKNITISTQKGLYVCFLFKKDMSGLYLTLNQGIKNFEDLYKSKKYENARKVADYFCSQIGKVPFSAEKIDLGTEKNTRGYGYGKATIIQKYYQSGHLNDKTILEDLSRIMLIYEDISKHMETNSYDNVIKNVLSDSKNHLIKAEEAIELIKQAVDPDDDMPFGFFRELKEVSPKVDRTNRYKRITNPPVTKIDFIQKASKDKRIGNLGEQLVLSYEIDRLNKIGLEKYANKVFWAALESDAYGYDIISYDLDLNGKVREIKIEVKTTASKVDDDFYVTRNELEKSKEYGNDYCIYRIYDVRSKDPKFYKAFGPIEDNFNLDPITYRAWYKSNN